MQYNLKEIKNFIQTISLTLEFSLLYFLNNLSLSDTDVNLSILRKLFCGEFSFGNEVEMMNIPIKE